MAAVKLIALRHLRKPGGGHRIERGSIFTADELRAQELIRKRHAAYAEEVKPSKRKVVGPTVLKDLPMEQLYARAQELKIKGRSTMSKSELIEALERADKG